MILKWNSRSLIFKVTLIYIHSLNVKMHIKELYENIFKNYYGFYNTRLVSKIESLPRQFMSELYGQCLLYIFIWGNFGEKSASFLPFLQKFSTIFFPNFS